MLAIDLTSRGFGYVVMEQDRPIDWGLATGTALGDILSRLAALIDRWDVQTLLIEDYKAPESKRCARVKKDLAEIDRQVGETGLRVVRVIQKAVLIRFAALGAKTKRERAVWLAARFPELARHLPPIRKPWMSENEKTGIFDAAAFAVVKLGIIAGPGAVHGTPPLGPLYKPDTSPGTP